MAITADGHCLGFVSNGCVEADLIATARRAIAAGEAVAVSYGRGSGKIDVVLPCGGRVDLLVVPVGPDQRGALAAMVADAGAARRGGILTLDEWGAIGWTTGDAGAEFHAFTVHPRIRLVVVGAGSEALFLARLGAASDMAVELHSPDEQTLRRAAALGLAAREMTGLSSPAGLAADPVTAVAVMFHDHEWERVVLAEALSGPAFYIGALGSRRAHAARLAMLAEAGVPPGAAARISAPIGLVHRLRDPNLLAAAVIAEIAAAFQARFTAF
jgi:xanthine dehydrogenase accessory factor